MVDVPLPEPESERLAALVSDGSLRLAYGLLYRRRAHPPTAAEVSFFLQTASASSSFDQVLHGLRHYFEIDVIEEGREKRYALRGWAGTRPISEYVPISPRLRAQILSTGRCGLCGKTPGQHGITLEVDLRVPSSWGGTNDPENLWPLCDECHGGWRQYLDTFAPYVEQISHAANYDEPQRRIGELLKAFDGQWVLSDLIGVIASAKEYQEDYQRRIRDLRFLGWDYEQEKRHHEGSRVKTYYRLTKWAPWPENIGAAIAAEARRRKAAKRAAIRPQGAADDPEDR